MMTLRAVKMKGQTRLWILSLTRPLNERVSRYVYRMSMPEGELMRGAA